MFGSWYSDSDDRSPSTERSPGRGVCRIHARFGSEAKRVSGSFDCFIGEKTRMGLSVRAYARHRKVAHVTVLRAIKSGRISPEPDGTIDAAKADATWDGASDPARSKPKERGATPASLRPIAEVAVGSVRETLKEQGLPASGSVTFVQARTAHEIAKAHLARLRLQRMKGELIDRARTTAMVFRLAREARDTWLNWPARAAALMASELGVDVHSMQKALETHVRTHLSELAEVKPDFR